MFWPSWENLPDGELSCKEAFPVYFLLSLQLSINLVLLCHLSVCHPHLLVEKVKSNSDQRRENVAWSVSRPKTMGTEKAICKAPKVTAFHHGHNMTLMSLVMIWETVLGTVSGGGKFLPLPSEYRGIRGSEVWQKFSEGGKCKAAFSQFILNSLSLGDQEKSMTTQRQKGVQELKAEVSVFTSCIFFQVGHGN